MMRQFAPTWGALRSFQVWSLMLTNKELPAAARVVAFCRLSLVFILLAGTELDTDQKNEATSAVGLLASEHPCGDAAVALTNPLNPGGGFIETERSSGHSTVLTWSAVKTANFRFAAHIARMSKLDIVHRVLGVRHIAWWSRAGQIHTNQEPRPHDGRFNAQHHKKQPLEAFSGQAVESQPENKCNWTASEERYLAP